MSDHLEQRSAEWHAARLAKVTASRVADVIARTKSGWGASRANYMAELIAERLTGEPSEKFTSAAMAWGTEKEPEARAAYAWHADEDVQEVGFVVHNRIRDAGASPDGLVGTNGLVEIKCPGTATHIDTLLSGSIADKYIVQMQFQMACTGRMWCDFVSYDPRLPEAMRLFVRRIERDHERIAQLETAVIAFLDEMNTKVAQLAAIIERKAA